MHKEAPSENGDRQSLGAGRSKQKRNRQATCATQEAKNDAEGLD